ncbi:MAG: type II toxin-antitoxin system VapC family toxin [Chloroflexota bacterium]|nr:type II toxin-antitoxin system VapC family toxin [Chloroflexota bacterium]
MPILIDTNVVSELMRSTPNARVAAWVAQQAAADLYVATITEAELRYGVAILPTGERRSMLLDAVEAMLREDFAGRILPFDGAAARAYAAIAANRRAMGRSIAHADCQIAAVARSRGFAVATRDIGDFRDTGVDLIDPWAQH